MHEDANSTIDSKFLARPDAHLPEADPVTSALAPRLAPRPVLQLVWSRKPSDTDDAATTSEAAGAAEGPSISPIDGVVGARIRLRREELGWSRAQLAANAEVPIAQLARFEAGSERLGAAVFLRISRVLGVRPAYLFDIEGRTSPQA